FFIKSTGNPKHLLVARFASCVLHFAGEDEQSTEMAARWEDEKVTEAASDGFVAIKIDTKRFDPILILCADPVVCVPSSFFIGDNGIPLEVIAGSVSVEELVTRIHKVKQVTLGLAMCSCFCSFSCVSFFCVCKCIIKIKKNSNNSRYCDFKTFHFVCKFRITKKLEERREEKRKEEEQKEIKKEIERRKTGKEMLEYKRRQEEELTKRMLEERNREKAEEKAARERIRQQIAMDRAERAARFAKSKEEAEAAKAAALQAKQAELEARKEASQKERSLVARIQFRLPDGSSFTNQFPSEARLEEARQFAAQTVGNAYGNFSLATMFPRREFTKEDYGKKLLELELVPSASVVLLPAGRPATSVVQASGGDLWKFLGTILYPLLAVWRFISNFLFTSPPPSQSAARTAHQQDHSNPSKPSNSEQSRQTVRKRVMEKRGEDFKKEGKIYRLRTQDDGEDENNTWNGNSTQQM
uniref:UBX domain-containing protein 4 n=1 Tax=Anas platyrhynchos TaxID=8839 RepID=A0A8B9TFG8_ANAPL